MFNSALFVLFYRWNDLFAKMKYILRKVLKISKKKKDGCAKQLNIKYKSMKKCKEFKNKVNETIFPFL